MSGVRSSAARPPDPADRFVRLVPGGSGLRAAIVIPELAAADAATQAVTGDQHLFTSEIFIRGSREERSACDYLCLVSVDGAGTGATPSRTSRLHLVGPGSIRSHATAIASGLLVGSIPVAALSRDVERIVAMLLKVPRHATSRRVIATIESLAVALDYARDADGSAALAWGIVDRIELLCRSLGASVLVAGSHDVGRAVAPSPYHLALSATALDDPSRAFHVKDGHLSVGASADAATPWREQEFILLRVGPRPDRVDVTRSIEDLRRLHVATQGNFATDDQNIEVASYQDKANRLRLVSRLTTLFGTEGLRRLPAVTPIAIEAAADLGEVLEKGREPHPEFSQGLSEMRSGLRYLFGIEVPAPRLRLNDSDMPPGSYLLMIREIPLVMGTVSLDRALCDATVDQLTGLGLTGDEASNPASGNSAAWVRRVDWQRVKEEGVKLWTADQYIVLHLSAVIRKNLAEFAGVQVVANLLKEKTADRYPRIRDAAGGLARFTSVLQALLSEEVPVRELAAICDRYLESTGLPTSDIPEEIRCMDVIRKDIPGNEPTTPVLRLGDGFVGIIAEGMNRDGDAAVLALEPEPTQEALSAVREVVSRLSPAARNPVLFVEDWRMRTFVRKLVELEFPHLWVLSRREALSPNDMPVLATIDV